MHFSKSLNSSIQISVFITLAALASSGCAHNAAVSAGTGANSGTGGIIPLVRQGSDFYPNWIRLPDTSTFGSGITVGPDGRIWETTNSGITRTDYWRTTKSYPIGSSANGIAPGPDGNIWFAEFSAGAIGRLNPATGKVDNFPDPSGGQPLNLIAGPDGKMWFTERDSGGKIVGRISMSGVIQEYSATKGTPSDLAAGPDGDVYFGESGVNSEVVGRITPSGQITEQSPGGAQTGSFATGPDGNVYFIDFAGEQLQMSRITSGFNINAYAWPSGGVEPGPLCAGPDGNIWIGGTLNNHVVLTIFDVATQQFLPQQIRSPNTSFKFAGGMVTGLDGNVWWTAPNFTDVYVYHEITASPDSLTFSSPGQQQTVTASETNFSGTLTASSTNTGIVTVMPGGGTNSFVVTSVATGHAYIRIVDGHHNNLGVKAVVQ